MRRIILLSCVLVTLLSLACQSAGRAVAVYVPAKASFAEHLAASEVRRYFYHLTGELLPLKTGPVTAVRGRCVIAVGDCDRAEMAAILDGSPLEAAVDSLGAESYLLGSVSAGGGRVLVVAGGDSLGTLYGAYRLAWRLGARFYLHGDVLPDDKIPPVPPDIRETGRPLFALRGIQPFHDFPEGPDWWDEDGYKAVLAQLPKLGMNFFGLHTYPQGGVGPEPTVWIGPRESLDRINNIRAAYPARHFTTVNGTWGYRPDETRSYGFGADQFFSENIYGADYMRCMAPWPPDSAACVSLFHYIGGLLNGAFVYARWMGIRTCIGTETPLTVPEAVRARLSPRDRSESPDEIARKIYAGMFSYISSTHPLDYYWFWTPENWTWDGASREQVEATLADLKAAIAAADEVQAPFKLATCGWVLGPQWDRALFDRELPAGMALSCINRAVGHDPVEPGFARIEGRGKWAIPWLEDDPALIVPQLWAGRMRRDAADALAYGCDGLMGIHWRTRELGPNVAALARAAWDQSGWNPEAAERLIQPDSSSDRPRNLPCLDFYQDWARAEFGPAAAEPAARLFAAIDGALPRPANWDQGPGGLVPDSLDWETQVAPRYGFVDSLAALDPLVTGPGARERFSFWLHSLGYLREVAHFDCTLWRFRQAMDKMRQCKDPDTKTVLAREEALPLRVELAERLAGVFAQLLPTVTTTGAMGTVTNWQQHVIPLYLGDPDRELTALLGPLPCSLEQPREYPGAPRLFSPVERTSLAPDETLNLQAIVVGAPAVSVSLHWRPLGQGEYTVCLMEYTYHGGVWRFSLDTPGQDIEYYFQAEIKGQPQPLTWPAGAPGQTRSVVCLPPWTNGMPW
ncbi:hypothetical protein LLH00_13875 [bacterium]|nr:hypothetical protein [bacterium]